MKIAYLGPEATFSHIAAENLFGKKHRFISADTIEDVFTLVKKNRSILGVVPVENSNAGSVGVTLDVFCQKNFNLKIYREYFLKINFQFVSLARNRRDIKLIYAHPMAIAQCRQWLRKNFPKLKIEEVNSNALAAKLAGANKNSAALSTCAAAQLYKIKILNKNIQDNTNNTTRFLAISKTMAKRTDRDKTSLLFSLKHEPGSLYNALGVLARHNVNMTRIESKIMKMSNWEYHFFVDIEGHVQDKNIKAAIKEMSRFTTSLKNLGSYPRGIAPWN